LHLLHVTKRLIARHTVTAKPLEDTELPDNCKPESVIAQLERILTNPPLESSPSLCRFLRYVVEETLAGRASSLKEYSLGVAAFDRGDEFDPRMDPIVRVQARNLRVRLGQYYAGPGANDPILIELPKRTYVPVFRDRVEEEALEPAPVSGEPASAGEAPAVTREVPVFVETPVVHVAEVAAGNTEIVVVNSTSTPTRGTWRNVTWVAALLLLAGMGGLTLWQARPTETRAKAAREPDPVAQDLYIRCRYLMDRQTEHALRESIDCFERAVQRDPQFASAYSGLADAYNILAQQGYIAPREGMEQARRAAERALEIDPQLAEGHVSLAAILEAYDWNWQAAEREYRRALELNPWLPAAHLWYGMFLRDQGRLKEALPELRRAAQLEPFSVFTSVNLAHAYMLAGNYGAAMEQAHHITEVAPDMVTAEVILANSYGAHSQAAEAEAALARGLRVSKDDDPHALAVLARAYAHQGKRDESLRLLRQLEQLSKQRYVSPFDLGSISLALGDEQHAVDLLEEAFRQRSSGMIFLRNAGHGHRSPQFDSLIEKMRFAS
jgi:tetratricopeptide (TPR) repeat protein